MRDYSRGVMKRDYSGFLGGGEEEDLWGGGLSLRSGVLRGLVLFVEDRPLLSSGGGFRVRLFRGWVGIGCFLFVELLSGD